MVRSTHDRSGRRPPGVRPASPREVPSLGQLGVPELLLIGAVALILFGPARLPELGRSLGRAMREFRNAVRSVGDDDDEDRPARGHPGGEAAAGEEGRRQPAG